MAGRPLSAAQLQHLRNMAQKGGKAVAAKYGGWHAAHQARHSKRAGSYVAPNPHTPFAGIRRLTTAIPPSHFGRAQTPVPTAITRAPVQSTKSTSTPTASRAIVQAPKPRTTTRRRAAVGSRR